MIRKCYCKHVQQDAMYGVGMRVFNPCVLPNKQRGWRCTVCDKTDGDGGTK